MRASGAFYRMTKGTSHSSLLAIPILLPFASRSRVVCFYYKTNGNSGCVWCGRMTDDVKFVVIAAILNVISEKM